MAEIGELVLRAREGDGEAFEALVRMHLRAAYTVALGVTNDATDAEDIVQDALVSALERIEDCKDPDRFSGWLLAIVRNRALNFRRAQSVRAATPLSDLELPSSANPEQDASRAQLREDLNEALAQLTELQRQVVLLHDLQGFKHREIGETLGISEGASRFHLSTARAALRAELHGKMRGEI